VTSTIVKPLLPDQVALLVGELHGAEPETVRIPKTDEFAEPATPLVVVTIGSVAIICSVTMGRA
jgi:hypothetical protein